MMEQYIRKYASLVDTEVKLKIQKDFNIKQAFFLNFNTFDFTNFYLIYNYILNDENRKDFFIGIPEKDFRPNFYSAIFYSLVLVKLYQNYFSYKKTNALLHKGDLICVSIRGEYRTLEVKNITGECAQLNYKFPRKNEVGINDFPLKNDSFTKLNPNFVENKNVVGNIQSYRAFLDTNFDCNFPLITDFRNKALVIAERKFYSESKFLPVRYMTKTGKIRNDLPFHSYMIECCNDYDTAKEYFFDNQETFDELIIIGNSKHKDFFNNIVQDTKWLGKTKNLIIIGNDKPNHEFIEWNWSKDEIRITNGDELKVPQKKVIKNTKYFDKLIELKLEIENIKNEQSVNLMFLLKYTNFYCRLLLVDSNFSKGICREYCDRLRSYFKSEKFEEEVHNQFFEQNIYNTENIQSKTNKILTLFEEISNMFERNNPKWDYIKGKIKNKNRKLYLLIDKRSFDAINNQLQNEKIDNIKCISDKRIDNDKDYLEKWIKDDVKNRKGNDYIIPYLNNPDLLDKLSLLNGNCEVLCYKGIDELAFEKVINHFQSEEKSRLTQEDRNEFIQSTFSFDEEYIQWQLEEIFKFDFTNDGFRNNPYESIDLPKEKVYYEIEFGDGFIEKLESSKGVFLIEDREQIKTTIGEIYEGATIRYYQNDNKDEYRKILKIFDIENLLDTFDNYANSWKQTLKKLLTKYENIEQLYQDLFNTTYKINYTTLRQYFDDNCDTRFPRRRTLEAIRNLCIVKNMNDELIVLEVDKFNFYSKKDHAIRQQVGRIIGSDLIDYVASNQTEKSESLKRIPTDILSKLVGTIKEKTVKRKILLGAVKK